MPGVDYAALRALVPIRRILEVIGYQPVRARRNSWRGPCPLHHSSGLRETCFSVDLRKNVYRCFSCQASGNQLDLWVALTRLPLYEATLDLCRRLTIDPPPHLQIGNSEIPTSHTRPTALHGS